MIRALTILATAALALPVGHYIDDALGTGVRKLGTTGALAAPVAATDEPNSGAQVGLLYRGAVEVGADGNGVRAARFATTVAGRDVRYVLVVENGCAGSNAVRPCPAPVRGLTVTLNEDVVFQNDDEFREARLQIALNPDEADDNSLVLAAKGAPGSGARVRILALRDPDKDKPKPKPEVLGLVYRDRCGGWEGRERCAGGPLRDHRGWERRSLCAGDRERLRSGAMPSDHARRRSEA